MVKGRSCFYTQYSTEKWNCNASVNIPHFILDIETGHFWSMC